MIEHVDLWDKIQFYEAIVSSTKNEFLIKLKFFNQTLERSNDCENYPLIWFEK